MLKLRFSSPSIRVYKDGKITVCRYECTLFNNNTKHVLNTFTVTGVAKCAEGDTLDPEYGKRLADSRAKFSAYKIASHFVSNEDLVTMFEEVVLNLDIINFIDSMRYLKKKEVEHIKFLNAEITG